MQVLLTVWQTLMPPAVNVAGSVSVIFMKKVISTAARDAGISATARVFIVFMAASPVYVLTYMICLFFSLVIAKWLFLGALPRVSVKGVVPLLAHVVT